MSSYQIPAIAPPTTLTDLLRGRAVARVFAVGAVLLMTLLVTDWIWQRASPLGFNDDAAQTLSTASQWQKGEGLTTTVLYYDSQLDQIAPAVQTVWPPAMAILTATISDLSGLPLASALVALLLLSHILTAAAIALVLAMAWRDESDIHHSSRRWWVGSVTALFWLTCAPAVLGVARGLSEPLYLAFAVLALLALVLAVSSNETPVWQRTAVRQWPWLLLASTAVTAALLTRYQAVALIVPLLMAASMVGAPGTTAVQRMRVAGAVVSLPVITLGLMFWRNWSTTGALTGGASAASGQSLSEMAARMSWLAPAWQQAVMWALLASMLLAGLLALVLWARGFNNCRSVPARVSRSVRTGLIFCLSAYATNLALLVLLGLMSTVYVLELRYLTINLMLLVLPAMVLLQQVQQVGRRWISKTMPRLPLALPLIIGGLLLLQMLAFQPVVKERLANAPPAQIAKILSTPLIEVAGQSERESPIAWLARQPSPPKLLSTNAQSLALVLLAYKVPVDTVIGLPLPVFTDRTWNSQQIQALANRHSVDLVMGLRKVPTWVFSDPLDTWLGETHANLAWLEQISATPDIFLGRIHQQVNSSLCGPQRSDKLLTIVAHPCD